MICHLVSRSDWAAGADSYRPASLDTEGFIHFSTPEQIVATANRFYAGRGDLLLVVVDPERLTAPLRWEAPAPAPAAPTSAAPISAGETSAGGTGPAAAPAPAPGELFPHLYGTFPTAAVTTVVPFPPGPDGVFTNPPGLW